MDKVKLASQVKLEEDIKNFVFSNEECLKLEYMIPIRDIEAILIALGFDELEMDGDGTNGWEVDFWYKFNHSTLGKFTLTGSLHYGEFELCREGEDDE